MAGAVGGRRSKRRRKGEGGGEGQGVRRASRGGVPSEREKSWRAARGQGGVGVGGLIPLPTLLGGVSVCVPCRPSAWVGRRRGRGASARKSQKEGAPRVSRSAAMVRATLSSSTRARAHARNLTLCARTNDKQVWQWSQWHGRARADDPGLTRRRRTREEGNGARKQALQPATHTSKKNWARVCRTHGHADPARASACEA